MCGDGTGGRKTNHNTVATVPKAEVVGVREDELYAADDPLRV